MDRAAYEQLDRIEGMIRVLYSALTEEVKEDEENKEQKTSEVEEEETELKL